MKINGLHIAEGQIGQGLYDLICQAGEESLVAFGMIPKWILDMFEKQLEEKIIAEAAKQAKCTVEEYAPHVDKQIVRDMVDKITREVSTHIYAAAKRAGKMVV